MPWIARIPLLAALIALLVSCAPLPDLDELATPRYQTGGSKGSAYCATCHSETYEQWSRNSRHAKATKSVSFHRAVSELKANIVLGRLIDEDMCYACHGDKNRNEGIDCESCHGAALPGVPIEVTHAKKYTPRLEEMRKPEFCATCHQMKMPFTGEALTTVHDEWKHSAAARNGLTCQGCHMATKNGQAHAYHGFDSGVRNPLLYKDKLSIDGIAVNSERLRLYLKNRVAGHSIPASGPTRILALELEMTDETGALVHRDVRRFFKQFSMLPVVRGVPFMLLNNTQLRSGERRRIRFDLPSGAYAAATQLTLVLRMYEVADQFQGDINKAHWGSKPIIRKTIKIANSNQSKKRSSDLSINASTPDSVGWRQRWNR